MFSPVFGYQEPRRLSGFYFLPDFTEHPKPQRHKTVKKVVPPPTPPPEDSPPSSQDNDDDSDEDEVTFFQDFVAGGMAGSASVAIGHPFDTLKVRVQSSSGSKSVFTMLSEFGGVSSLYRGMTAPLSAAAAINAVVFSSYGVASRLYDQYLDTNSEDDLSFDETPLSHDPWQKAMMCGSFAGFTQCFIICPMEHIKCRLQVQHGKGSADNLYKGPVQAIKSIVKDHGVARLYQGWWCTFWREIPAFGLYFASYDFIKDKVNTYFSRAAASTRTLQNELGSDNLGIRHSHTWMASAIAGGSAGCITWALVYPVDMIKTRIQTAPLTTPNSELRMLEVGRNLVQKHGWRYLFRGFGVTILRAFPTNATLFPVYEFTLLQLRQWQSE
mmetsp:Transcript_2575/g.3444  ORF Transcript_2575/g.3444 Transcript_2575/m.3444 type:complete len:384 (+) Transcript_2575:244-1395(+)